MNSVLLLGALSDMGKSLASKYAEKGWNVWLAGRNVDDLNLLKNDIEIRTQNLSVRSFHFDALDYSSHHSFYKNLPAGQTLSSQSLVTWVRMIQPKVIGKKHIGLSTPTIPVPCPF